jgi:hypothetical protein
VLCRECDREIYRSLSHKRFRKEFLTFVDLEDSKNIFPEWLKCYQWSDIEFISFSENFIDVVYLNEVIQPQDKEKK